jgi:hemerythrin
MRYIMDSSFMTGHELIDGQHRQLFDSLNSLIEACEKGKGQDELLKNLDFLNEYTIKHFFDEEQLQRAGKYPDCENHKKLHDAFKTTVREFRVKMIMEGVSTDLALNVQKVIGDWLVTHIKGQDIKVGAHLKAQAR